MLFIYHNINQGLLLYFRSGVSKLSTSAGDTPKNIE